MKDMAGNTLNAGDMVAYGARSGNTGELRIGIIVNPEKAQMLSGTYTHRTYDWQTKEEVDEYNFNIGGSLGNGVHGSRLLKLDPMIHNDIYTLLVTGAEKWLNPTT